MQFDYQTYCTQMNQLYYNICNWPQPYHYQNWYEQLPQEQQVVTLHPTQYTQIYTYTMQNYSAKATQMSKKPPKLSRNQKRKIKKKQLQQQLERETKEIGKWVKLQRKDLIEDLQKINKQQQKKRKKKEDKLGHLIQINKQVSKQYKKKDSSSKVVRRVNTKKNKKRISFIKQLNSVFEKNRTKMFGGKNKDEEWQSDEEEKQIQKKQVKLQKIEEKQQQQEEKGLNEVSHIKKEIVEIEYKNIGKLTGVKHNNMILREWVRNYPSQTLNDSVLRIVNRLAYKQAIRKVQKPEKAKKLIVSGLKQCKRTITTILDKKRSKMLIVALNVQRNPYKGGVDDQVQTVIQLAQQMKIPIIHACLRSHLGRAFTGKWGPRLTMISIINFEGYQDMIEQMLKEWKQACLKYDSLP